MHDVTPLLLNGLFLGRGTLLSPIGLADGAPMLRHPGLAGGGALVAAAMFARTRRHHDVAVTLPAMMALFVLLHEQLTLSSEFWGYGYDANLLGLGVFSAAVVAQPLEAIAVLLCAALSGARLLPEHRVHGVFSTTEDAAETARLRAEVTHFYADAPLRHGYQVRVF